MKKIALSFISILGLTLLLSNCNYDKPLKRELITIWNEDQDIRNEVAEAWKITGNANPTVDSLNKLMHYIDSINLVKVTKILDEKGWVGKDKIGKLASNTLWMVIQHSDLKTQQKYLPMMRDAVKEGKTEASWLALLEDRVALGEGRKQIYGSQIFWNKKTNKSYVAPLEDPDNVDKRRSKVGLDPFTHYLKQYNIVWDAEDYKKQLPELEMLTNNTISDEKLISIADYRNSEPPVINANNHKDKDVEIFKIIFESQTYSTIMFRIDDGRLRGYKTYWTTDNDYDRASYKWINDSTLTVKLFNSSDPSSESFTMTGFGNSSGLQK